MAPSSNPNWPANASEIDKIIELLKEGKETIQLNERYRNVTLVLGTTGSGQSTFVQWLAGDSTKLLSELVPGTLNEFIVKDDSRSGNSTIQSVVPELVVDPVTDLAYYDCPKFAQSASTDIVGKYFTKAVADYAENVRLIFTVPYSAVRVGMDRIAFPELLKHSTDLVKNVDKYRNSIALVATNVDNTVYQDENEQIVDKTDEQIIDSIANFLKNVREELKRDTTTETYRNYIKFIDALLQRDGQAYSKIGIFRRPYMPGLLSEMASLQQSKTKLVEKVKQLELIPIEADDFGYSFSGKTKNVAYELVSTLNNRVWHDADIIAQEMARMLQLLPVHEIRTRIWMSMKDFGKMRSVEQFTTVLGRRLNFPTLSENDVIRKAILNLFNSGKQLNFLNEAISDQPVNTWSMAPLSASGSSVNIEWNRFLSGLYSKLGEYQFQQNPRQYNVANLEDWGEGETKPQNIHIDERNFNQFLHKLNQHNISGLDALKDTQIARWQLDELNQVLSSTLKHGDAKLDCTEDGKLVVTGNYVKLSELKPRLVDICPNRINSVNIFASNTIFFDSDLDGLGSQLKLTLSAPKWEVVGQRRINLDGSAGAAPNPPKARNSDHAGINPEKGRPGQFGGHAGSFLGLAQQFVNREGLTVTANGGSGGDGQEGGDGHDGERGSDAPVPDQWCHFNAPYEVTWTKTEMHGFTQYNYTDYRIYGSSGTEGGVGGDGGAGGTGGQQGVIELYNLDGSNKQKIDTKSGNDGSGGRGGIGGYDGLHGNDLAAHCEFYFTWGFWTRKYMSSEAITYDHRNRAANGRDGANHDQNVRLSEVVSLNWHSTNAISEFKNFLSSKLNDVNDRFMGLSAIVDQLGKIERKFGSLENGGLSHSTAHLDSLLSQITKYAEALQPTRDLDHIKKKHNYLTQVNKLYNLSSSPEPNMIFDVDGFLYYVQEIIDILNKLRHQQQGPEHEIVQQQLANLIANIKTDHLVDSADPQLLVVAKELETLIRSSFVLQQYDSVVVALKQLVFPYAKFYVDEEGFNRDSTDIEYLVNSAVASLSKMRSRVLDNRSSIWRVDQYVHRANFDSSNVVTSPFHVWLNGENRNAIGKLLSGESVVLNADIRLSDSDKDAIKFSLLEINLKAKNSTTQAEINAELNNFLVSVTHLGNSNYRYGDKHYLINNIPLNIEYSFEKDSNGNSTAYNHVYNKIKSGDLMASPYAMWQIQLSKMNELVSFDRLAKYRDEVDLELVGQGIYTESQRARSDYLQVDRYYSEYVDQSNVTERQQLNSAKVRKVSNSLHRSQDRLPNQAINSSGQLSYMSRFGETVSNLFGSTVKTRHIAHPRFDYTKQERNANSNTNSMTQSSNSLDVQGNLLLGQLLVGLIAGKNGTLSSDSFMSPEKAREVQVKSLAQRIVPALSQPSATRSSQLYNSNIQWHRDWNATSRELHN